MEIVRGHIEAFRGGDARRVRSRTSIPMWCGTRVGLTSSTSPWPMATKTTFRHYIGAFEDYDFVAQRLTDLGSGAVLALLSEEGRGKSSGVPVRQSFAVL